MQPSAIVSSSVPTLRPSRTAVLLPVIGLALAALGGWIGEVLRHDLIEPVERAAACMEAPATWWCPVRDAVRIAAQNYVIAGVALALALGALVLRGRAAAALLLAALFLAGAGLYLYSASLSAIAVVLALLRAAAAEHG